MKKALICVLATILVVAVGFYVVVVRPLVSPAAQTFAAEAALATPDLILLAAVNVRQAVFLERWYLGAPAVATGTSRAVRPPAERTILEHLAAARVDMRRDVEHVLYGLYPATEQGVRHALVIVGQFDAPSIEQYVARDLRGTARPDGGRTSYEVRRVDPDRCESVTTWMITVDPRWILISDAAAHATLLPRLTQIPAADEAELAWWQPLAHSDVLSIGMWRPRDAHKTVTTPTLQASAQAAIVQAADVEHLYLGLGAKTVPPSGRLRLVLDAADAPRLRQKIEGWERAVRESRARWARVAPSLGALFDSLSVKESGSRQTIEFTVDRALASNLSAAVNELLAALFSGFGAERRPSPATAGPPAERIDSDATVFVPVTAASALGQYDASATFAEDVDQVQGPFGIRLSAMRMPSEGDAGLELEVEAFAAAIPNVTGSGDRARLFVDSLTSTGGQALLRVEDCGRQRSTIPGPFTDSGGRRLRAKKAVRLAAGADPHTLGSVAGRVELRLPTRVEMLSVTRPAPGAKLASHGATVTFTKVEGGEVAYRITGVTDRVLDVRALNAAGRPLASEMKLSGDFLFGDGMAGKPAGSVRDTTPDFRPYTVQALRRDVPRANPFELSFDRAQSFFTTRLDFTLRSPALPNFERAFTVGRLQLQRVELKDGTTLTPPTGTAVRFGTAAKDGVLTRPLFVLLDAKPSPDAIKAVFGVLTMQFPRTIRTLHLDDLTPGQHAEAGGMSVTVTARGRRSLTLQTDTGGERILYVRLTDADGRPVVSFSPNIMEIPDGAWRFELAPQGAPAHAEVIFAGDLERKDYPFRLEPNPSRP